MKVCELITNLFAKYYTIVKLPTILDSFYYATRTYIGEEWRWQGARKWLATSHVKVKHGQKI